MPRLLIKRIIYRPVMTMLLVTGSILVAAGLSIAANETPSTDAAVPPSAGTDQPSANQPMIQHGVQPGGTPRALPGDAKAIRPPVPASDLDPDPVQEAGPLEATPLEADPLEAGPLEAGPKSGSEGGAGIAPKIANGWPAMLGMLKSREVVIDSPRLTINLPEKGGVARVTVSSGPAMTPLMTMIQKLAFKTVELKNGTFVIRTPSGFTQTIYGVNATISGDNNASLTNAKGSFNFRGEELKFDISSVKGRSGDGQGPVPVSIRLRGEKLRADLAGSISLQDGFELEGKLNLSLPDLKFASAWLGYPLDKNRSYGELQANGAFSWKGSVLSFVDAIFNAGGNQAKGAFSIDLAGARPRMDGTLALERIDIDKRFIGWMFGGGREENLSATAQQASSPALPLSAIIARDSSLDIGYLNDFDAGIRLSAETVALGGLIARDCAFTLTLKYGDLFFGLVESKIAGGLAHGEFDLKTIEGERQSKIRANLENVKIDQLVEAFNLNSPFAGTGELKADLSGHGASLAAHMKTLSGELSLTTENGLEFKFNPAKLKWEPGDYKKLHWWIRLMESSRFEDFKADFVFKDGLAISRSILIQGRDFGLAASGSINIPARRFFYSFQRVASAKFGTEYEAGFKDNSVSSIVVHGPWKALRLAPEISEAAKDAAPEQEKAPETVPTEGERPKAPEAVPGRG